MPRNKNFKRLVRERMAKTGESYAAARAQLLATEVAMEVNRFDHPLALGDAMSKIMPLANDEARIRNHPFLEPQHVLLALLDEGGEALGVLRVLKVSPPALRASLERTLLPPSAQPARPLISDAVSDLLALAVDEAAELGCEEVNALALLLATASLDGPAAAALAEFGATETALRAAVRDRSAYAPDLGRVVSGVVGDALDLVASVQGLDAADIVDRVETTSVANRTVVTVVTKLPGLIVGRRGSTADVIRRKLVEVTGQSDLVLNIEEARAT